MSIDVNLNIRNINLEEQVTEILLRLRDIQTKQGEFMALSQNEIELLNKIDAATTKIGNAQTELAADIQALIDNPNTTLQEFRDLLGPKVATLEAQAEYLTQLAANTNAPIPPTEPPVE